LLPTEYEAYKQAFGLTQLKRMIIDEEVDDPLFHETTVAWDNRISRLFKGIDDGYDLNETEIPAYNGGLFNEEESEENQFLARNKLYGSYIKEILELLATSYDEEKQKRIILDYKDLNIRHLGSVYEGLLEHKFKAADERKILKNSEWTDLSETNKDWEEFDEEKRVQENELYLTNESGERKATGSYYTPEYIVEYIVENTVGPKVEEKIQEAEENNSNVLTKILELNICDPAMGSGHFLTEATEYIAEHIVQHADLEKQNLDENEDELNWAKRQVVQNCIYGVDVNELAVELGKNKPLDRNSSKRKALELPRPPPQKRKLADRLKLRRDSKTPSFR
jgi:type I restriction-modification system DNA methylase subunit